MTNTARGDAGDDSWGTSGHYGLPTFTDTEGSQILLGVWSPPFTDTDGA